MDEETAQLIWIGAYLAWFVVVFVFRQWNLYPVLMGLLLGTLAGGLVAIFAGRGVGVIVMFVVTAIWSWSLYRKPPASR